MNPLPVGAAGSAPVWSAAWADALAELEMSVAEAETLLRAAHPPEAVAGPGVVAALSVVTWTPPSGLGVLPAPLAERATALLDRQLQVGRRLAEAAAYSRRQLRAVDSMRATAEAAPVYLDAAG